MTDFESWIRNKNSRVWVTWYWIDPKTGNHEIFCQEKRHPCCHIKDMGQSWNTTELIATNAFKEFYDTGQTVIFSSDRQSIRWRLIRALRAFLGQRTEMYFKIEMDPSQWI